MAWCPLTRWHAIFTQLRCQASQMFFISTGKLSIAGLCREASKCQLLWGAQGQAKERLFLGVDPLPPEVSRCWHLSGVLAAYSALAAGYGHVPGLGGNALGQHSQEGMCFILLLGPRSCHLGSLLSMAQLAAWKIPGLAGCTGAGQIRLSPGSCFS